MYATVCATKQLSEKKYTIKIFMRNTQLYSPFIRQLYGKILLTANCNGEKGNIRPNSQQRSYPHACIRGYACRISEIDVQNNFFGSSKTLWLLVHLKGISTTAALRCASLRCAAIVSDSPR